MKRAGQAGRAAVWGVGALLLAIGAFALLRAHADGLLGESQLAALETFLGAVLVLFAAISFWMAHR